MQIHGPGYCSCHAPSPGGTAPSTGFSVLIVSLGLLLAGLVSHGVISLRFW